MPNFRPKRKSEMWMSHNRVLIGGNKKTHARNPNFETEETKLLISLWGDPKVQKTLITTHKKHPVIAKLAESMRSYGYYRSPAEINTRLKNLKCFYNRIKKDMEMGVINQPTWKHYDAMDEILNRPIFGSRLTMQQQQMQHKILHDEATKNLKGDEGNMHGMENIDSGELIVPKEEPLDIDDSDEINEMDLDNESSDSFPSQLAQYLRVAPKASNSQNINNSDSQDSGEPLIAPEDIKKSPPSSPPPKQVTTSSGPKILPKPSNTPTSKISLVPTNILLKPQAQKMALNTGQTTFFMKNTSTGAVQAINSVANSQPGMPMKVLLVNTLPKSSTSTPTIISNATQVMTHATTVTKTTSQPQDSRHIPPYLRRNATYKVPPAKPSATIGFRTLLSQVVQQQTLSLQVARERLSVERERLAFEKATGEKLLEVLPLLKSISDHVTGRRTSQRLRKPANSISHDSDD